MEVFMVDPKVMTEFEGIEIPAGTLAIIPSIDWDKHNREREQAYADDVGNDFDDSNMGLLPEGTVLCAGQTLLREHYPELSRLYTEAGGFYEFQIPDMRRRFIIGVKSETNEIMWGDVVIYYDHYPARPKRIRDIRQDI